MIKTKHNSNHKTKQTTLTGEIIPEYNYYLLGFVPADVVSLKKDVWFTKLDISQINRTDEYFRYTLVVFYLVTKFFDENPSVTF